MLSFLGNGSAFDPIRSDTSAFFRCGDALFMIDAGGTVFKNALRKRIFDGVSRVYIILTHLHTDHCGSLGQLVMYLLYKRGIKPVILFPDDDVRALLKINGVSEDMYEIVLRRDVCTEEDMVKIRFIDSAHVDKINCYSLEISVSGGKKIYYSGDSNSIPPEVLKKFLDGGYDAIYQDTCGEKIKHSAHLNIDDLCCIIPEDKRNKIYCIHLDPVLCEDEIRKKGFMTVGV